MPDFPDGKPRKCPICQREAVLDGTISASGGPQFSPVGVVLEGYDLKGFACLNCGFVGHYLGREALQTLRQKVETKGWRL